MKRLILFVNAGGLFVLLLVAVGFAPTKAFAQGQVSQSILSDLSSKKNGPDDIANSLVGAPRKYGKGEKKEQISAAELKSKSLKDTTFGGSLLNAGITGAEPKFDETAHPVSKDSRASEHPAAKEDVKNPSQSEVGEKQPTFSDLSATATLGRELDDSGDVSQAQQTKSTTASTSATTTDQEQRKNQTESKSGTGATAGDKTSTSSSAKSSSSKPDEGGH